MNAVAPIQINQARSVIERLAPEFAKALPPGVSADRFRRVCLTSIQQNEKLLECSPDSLWAACMKAAQDGLMPDGREGAIVPRWNNRKRTSEAHWMPMVAGLIAKAKRKGSVVSLSAQIVYEGERFQVLLGDEDRIDHAREISKVQQGKEIAVYAIATMKDGSKEREVMSWDEVMQVADMSQKDKEGNLGNVWRTWRGEMARKSCIRRLSKRLPSLDDGDDDLRRTIERVDELYDFKRAEISAPVERKMSLAYEPAIPNGISLEQETVGAMSSLDEDLQSDQIPDFDTPPPPKKSGLEKATDWLAPVNAGLDAVIDQDGYNAVMQVPKLRQGLVAIERDYPALYATYETARAGAMERIVPKHEPDYFEGEQTDEEAA